MRITLVPGALAFALARKFEGCAKRRRDGRLEAYPDPGTGGAPWTIGWGSTTDVAGRPITPGTIWTQRQADERFEAHLREFAKEVARLLGAAPTTQGQFDALVDFAYNLGAKNLGNSTLLKLHKAGNYAGAALEFPKWNKAAGRVLPGLVKRRAAEMAVYQGKAIPA